MKLYLHCGFPKTGTTALQKWLSTNQSYLREHGIDYPDLLRDEEAIAHHRINDLVESGAASMARDISLLYTSISQSSIFLSSEGLSNLLGSDQPSRQAFLGLLLDELTNLSIDTTLIFTLRPLESYVKSIVIQNILYDRLSCKPSTFGAYTIDALARAYQNISLLLSSKKARIFLHSMQVNQEIVDSVLKGANGCSTNQIVFGSEHISPSEILVILFMWINYHGISVSPDLYSYLRFGESSSSILEDCSKRLVATHSSNEKTFQQWEPSSDLFHAVMGYFNMAWSSHFGFKASQLPDKDDPDKAILRKIVLSDCKLRIFDVLSRLDKNYEMALDPSSHSLLTNTFTELVKAGSIEYGKCLFDIADLRHQLDDV
jgi:hypothetical protein